MQYSTMERLVSLLLLYGVLFDTGGLVVVVSAQVKVLAGITPVTDHKEGEEVVLTCVAINLEPNHIVSWRTRDPDRALTLGDDIMSTDPRYDIDISHQSDTETAQVITISDLHRDDTNEYICSVIVPIQGGGYLNINSSRVSLSVFYFASESFPMCFPDGLITVDTGTELNMKCTSESGNPRVRMEISQIPMTSNPYTWSELMDDGNAVWRALSLTADESHNNVRFKCMITSWPYPGKTQSCTIGPMQVTGSSVTTPELETSPPGPPITATVTSVMGTASSILPSASNAGLIAGTSVGGVAALVCILTLILFCQRRRVSTSKQKQTPTTDVGFARRGHEASTFQQDNSHPNVYTTDALGIGHPPLQLRVPQSIAELGSMADDPTPPVYAKPHANTNHGNNYEDRAWKTDLADAAEQSYAYPVFKSKDRDDTTRGERPLPPTKPLAMVPPMTRVPKKPASYKSKAEPSRAPAYQPPPQQHGHGQESAGRSTSTPAPADLQDTHHAASQDDGYTGSREASTASHQVPTYAQVTRHTSDTVTDPAPEDCLLYADLDLSDPFDDKAAPQSDQTVYALVTHM